MKILTGICVIILILTIAIIFNINGLKNIEYQHPEFLSGKRILTVYFSNSGNTEKIAENIRSIVGGDIAQIKLQQEYPNNIFKMSKTVRLQINQGVLPEIADVDISNYDIVFVGSPVWAFSVSLPVKSFLKNSNFENKTIVPFFTCGAYASKSRLIREIRALASANDVKNPFVINAFSFLAKERVVKWLNEV